MSLSSTLPFCPIFLYPYIFLQFLQTYANIFGVYIRKKITNRNFDGNNSPALLQEMKMGFSGSTHALLSEELHVMKAINKIEAAKKAWEARCVARE